MLWRKAALSAKENMDIKALLKSAMALERWFSTFLDLIPAPPPLESTHPLGDATY